MTVEQFDYGFMTKVVSYLEKSLIPKGFPAHCIRIIAKCFALKEIQDLIRERMTEAEAKLLAKHLIVFINSDEEVAFCNACNLASNFVQVVTLA